MTHPKKWLAVRPEGLYCIPGQFYVDPLFPVDKAIVTHGHSDHARYGHKQVIATNDTLAIMKIRYQENFAEQTQALTYGESLTHNQVKIRLLPAGHILGSAQVVLEFEGSKVIISGDYKRAYDPTCASFEVESCDVFITEATFSLPVFKHPLIENELQKLIHSTQQFPERCHLVGVYALGKCQRVIVSLRKMGYHQTIYIHGALQKLCDFYQQRGFDLGDIQPALELTKEASKGKIVLCPPTALHDRWTRRFEDVVIANASGWMQIRARAKQKGVELPLVISDHADWNELTQTINDINPQEIWVTHGREDALVYYAVQAGYKARALSLLGYEEDED